MKIETQQRNPETGLSTKRQVAAEFAVCPKTISRWTQQGRLKAIRVNDRVIRYARAAVSKLIEDGMV